MRRRLFEAEHEVFRESVRAFVSKEIAPHLEAWDAEGIVPRELFTTAGAAGFLGMAIPERFGGGGVSDFRFNAVLGEEIMCAGAAGAGLGLSLHNDICLPYFLDLATEEQQRRWLPGIASGELITAIAMTEPGMGSDLAGMATTVVYRSDHYLINGSKTFVSSGVNADLVITAVKTNPRERHQGMSLLVVERGMEGFERGRNLAKLGQHAQDTAELFFRDVKVPVANLLGTQGRGFAHLVDRLPQERLSMAVSAVAGARTALAL
ncbi:MAG TPA: acyl-CoA dehydrogenase family protein, partial [Pseudonocardiaceae bacterium]|nr:acyl-CoA dehydrogenase family protein [Pseudonocardiaceae bacterium]